MAEYHRILSYLYRYDYKDKIDCKGFVKAEQRQNGLKLTLQIDDERLMEKINLVLSVYEKKGETWEMQRLATLQSGRHREEMSSFYPTEQLPEGFDIRTKYGVILFYQKSLYYGSVWIGDEIPIDDLLRQMNAGMGVISEEKKENSQSFDGEGKASKVDVSSAKENEVTVLADRSVSENVLSDLESVHNLVNNVNTDLPERAESDHFVDTEEDSEDKVESTEQITENIVDKSEKKTAIFTKPGDSLQKMWMEASKKAKPVDNIFNAAFREGCQITINQMKDFCLDAPLLQENQFLVNGYKVYHHLLAGKVMYAGEERYCIGVPGIYENRERYMAQIYQFPVFLSMTENRIKTGGFGYWLHLL